MPTTSRSCSISKTSSPYSPQCATAGTTPGRSSRKTSSTSSPLLRISSTNSLTSQCAPTYVPFSTNSILTKNPGDPKGGPNCARSSRSTTLPRTSTKPSCPRTKREAKSSQIQSMSTRSRKRCWST